MTTIKFTNEDLEPISSEQLGMVATYYKIIFENDIKRKTEFYVDGKLDGIKFYRKESESIEDIFILLNTNTVDIIDLVKLNNNLYIRNGMTFINGVNTFSQRELMRNETTLCEQYINVKTNIPILNTTVKYMYENNKDDFQIGEEELSFHFNVDGTLDYVSGNRFPLSEYNQTASFYEMEVTFPNLLAENPYYANAEFFPEGEL